MKPLASALFIALLAATAAGARAGTGAGEAAEPQGEKALKAAFIFNFAKFTEWPVLPAGAPIVACIVGDDPILTALQETVKGQRINGHGIDVQAVKDAASLRSCHLVFVGAGEGRRMHAAIHGIDALPVLTVSDGNGFSRTGGMIEMYVEDGRIRFAINVRAVERSGLRLSSRLLDLARIVRGSDVP